MAPMSPLGPRFGGHTSRTTLCETSASTTARSVRARNPSYRQLQPCVTSGKRHLTAFGARGLHLAWKRLGAWLRRRWPAAGWTS